MASLRNAWPEQTCGCPTEYRTAWHLCSMELCHKQHTAQLAACLQTYMLKLSKSGEEGEKVFLVLESGTRFHTTQVTAFKAVSRRLLSRSCTCPPGLLSAADCMNVPVRAGMQLASRASCRWWHFTCRQDQALEPRPKSCTSSSVMLEVLCKPLLSAPARGSTHVSCTLTPSWPCLPAVSEGKEQHPQQLHAEAAQAPARPAPGGREAVGGGPHCGLSVWERRGGLSPHSGAVLAGEGLHGCRQ